MKLRKRQLVLLTITILLLVVGLAATLHHLQAKRALTAYQKQLIASGEKLTVDEMRPKPIPDEENSIHIYYRSLALMNVKQEIFRTNPPAGMTMVAPGKARVQWAQPEIRSDKATNSWDDTIAVVNNLSNGLAALEELIDHPKLDFNLNYHTGFSLLLPHLARTKQTAQMLYYAALCDLHHGDTASATIRLRTILAISQASTDEPLVISQLVRIAIAAIGTAGTWELLQSPRVTDEQLAQLQSDWTRLDFTLPAENALAMERAMSQMTVEQMRESSAEFRKIATGSFWPAPVPNITSDNWFDQVEQFTRNTWENTRLKANETAWRFSWAYTDQLRTLKGNQVLIESLRQVRSNGNFKPVLDSQDAKLEALGFYRDVQREEVFPRTDDGIDFRHMFSRTILSLPSFYKKVMTIEISRQIVVTAIALQRYKLRHGNLPSDLAALVPDFLPAAPRDPVDGKPLRYKPNTDGTFLLYSVGDDGEDNGGDPKHANPNTKFFAWQRGRDWVWPQPATLQEIENYFMNRSK